MSFINYEIHRTLRDINETEEWQAKFESSLVEKCCDIYNSKILSDYNVEDMRMMIGQSIGLDYIVPLALDELEGNLLAEGDFYQGDLLESVSRISNDFWNENPEQRSFLKNIISQQVKKLEEIQERI